MKKKIFIVAIIVLVLILIRFFNVDEVLRQTLYRIRDMGWPGVICFIVLYVVATVAFLPGAILTLGCGAIYGVVKGTIIVSIASTLGATAAFLVGRYFARGFVQTKVSGKPKFQAIDQAVGAEGWKIVGLTRLSPLFPFNLLNYAYGLTSVSLKHYFWASWIGMLPGTVMYVYIGSLAGSLATVGAEQRQRTTAEWVLYGIGLIATIAVTVLITHKAKEVLNQKVDQ